MTTTEIRDRIRARRHDALTAAAVVGYVTVVASVIWGVFVIRHAIEASDLPNWLKWVLLNSD